MQEQSRLEEPRDYIAPVNRLVKLIKFSRVLERIENERDQTEDVKVRGTRCGPAPQQDIHSNAKIDQRDQPQPLVQRALDRNQDDHAIQRNGCSLQGVRSLRPRAGSVQLMNQSCCAVHLVLIYRQYYVAIPDARLICWTVSFYTVGGQVPVALNPPDTIVGNLEFAL